MNELGFMCAVVKKLLFVLTLLSICSFAKSQNNQGKLQYRIGLRTSYSILKMEGRVVNSDNGIELKQPNYSLETGIWINSKASKSAIYSFFEFTRRSYDVEDKLLIGSPQLPIEILVISKYRLLDSEVGVLYFFRMNRVSAGLGASLSYRSVFDDISEFESSGDSAIDQAIRESVQIDMKWSVNSIVQIDFTLIQKEKVQILATLFWKKNFLSDRPGGLGVVGSLNKQNWSFYGIGVAMRRSLT